MNKGSYSWLRNQCGWMHLLASVIAAMALALKLSTKNFHRLLNSDHLYPHMFVKDWLFGGYPIDAWKFGSATFLFPDYPIYAGLLLAFGDSGITFPIAAVVNMLLLGFACGFAVRHLTPLKGPGAYATGYYVIMCVLLVQVVPHHEYNLYWLLLPGFHGSCLTLGIICLVLLMKSWSESRKLSRNETIALFLIGIPGAYSNTLLLTQFFIPWLLMAGALAWFRDPQRRAVFGNHLMVAIGILVGVLLIRFALWVLNIWEYGKVFRHFPFPLEIWRCFRLFVTDLSGLTGIRLWAFWLVYLLALFRAAILIPKSGDSRFPARELFLIFAIISVFVSVALPIVALYWKDYYNTRYFLNLLVLPPLAFALIFVSRNPLQKFPCKKGVHLLPVPILVAGSVLLLQTLRHPERFTFPYHEAIAEFDALVEAHNLRLGLSGYWQCHYFNQLGKSNAYLNHVRADGSAYFWCNNIYWYYGPNPAKGRKELVFPDYDFVLVQELDEAEIIRNYGKPEAIIEGNYNRIFIYRGADNGIRSTLEEPVAKWLEDKALPVADGGRRASRTGEP